MPDALPDSKTHRLCFFPGAPDGHKHELVPNFVADEVEELREFVKFLYPQRGQDRFKLHRPDVLEMRWTVYSRDTDGISRQYAAGATPREALRAALSRFSHELDGERTLTPFSLPEESKPNETCPPKNSPPSNA